MKLLQKFNFGLILFPIFIFSLGFVTLFSTSVEKIGSHIVFFLIGVVLYLLTSFFDYFLLIYYWKYIYLVVLVLLLLTFVIGNTQLGATRWLSISEFTFQPSEFAKIAVILTVSALVTKKGELLRNPNELIKLLLLIIPLALLVFVQPDLGTAIVLITVFLVTLFYAGFSKQYIFFGMILFGLLSSPVWNLLKQYQKERILVFLNPQLDKLGAGYNVIQSTIAIGSGGVFGRGFGRGTQSHLQFLPVYWTDFIFAAFAEEWGFVGVLAILLVYLLLLLSILYVAYKTKDTFGSLICVGVFTVFFFQFAVNVGMNLSLMPVTGIPLPLVSSGGSSMIASLLLLGIVQSVWVHKKVN